MAQPGGLRRRRQALSRLRCRIPGPSSHLIWLLELSQSQTAPTAKPCGRSATRKALRAEKCGQQHRVALDARTEQAAPGRRGSWAVVAEATAGFGPVHVCG